ncbi:rhodanese-like domain-containing protein [Sphingopyxis sp.]|jgi:rhodanese-related sulfurtransferase|uniref:rhodanese-like domain-containing protein n=1 Tax=Sphingopyxis sp. TaxID=1908224 RepID=UPI0025E8AFB3|nr:rhodanese-like domain-containing protein [Sphingopyxis sp.]
MMLSLFRRPRYKEIPPQRLAALLDQKRAILVDVREADEFAAGHVASALSVPLSRFRASALPVDGDKPVILMCAAGRRSAMALEKAAAARPDIDTHLAGGLTAWRAAGLPVVAG